jgi:phospholipid/cholesterol/gamma-HCH transport system ATP-binding protein
MLGNSNSNSPEKGNPAIELRSISKSFRSGRDKVLRNISIKIPSRQLTYILGPSGTGKSVMIKHILGLLKPDAGEIIVHGQEISQLKGKDLKKHRECFGMLFQNSALFDDFTVFDNVAFPLREHTQMTEAEISTKVKSTLSLLGMPDGHDKLPNELSGGMRKRVGLARAIVHEPSILLYDEPTTGLDPLTRTTVDELIATLKENLRITSVVISHDIPSALKLADQIVFLFKGEVAFIGTPKEFKNSKVEIIQQFLHAEQSSYSALQH